VAARRRDARFPFTAVRCITADKDWKHGGATNIDTLGFACEPHNMLVENGGWRTRKLRNGDTEWIPPPHLPLKGGVNSYHHPERFLRDREGP